MGTARRRVGAVPTGEGDAVDAGDAGDVDFDAGDVDFDVARDAGTDFATDAAAAVEADGTEEEALALRALRVT